MLSDSYSLHSLFNKLGVNDRTKLYLNHGKLIFIIAFKRTQWLFVRHPYGDLYLLFVRESEDFMGFLCNS